MPNNIRGSDNFDSEGIVEGSAKAWVNFNGEGVVAIRDSFNVASITDNAVGDYTINFSNALSSANYAVVFGTIWQAYDPALYIKNGTVPSTTGLSILSRHWLTGTTEQNRDTTYAMVSIFA